MEPDDADLAALAADFRHRDGSDRWRVWANNGRLYAWRLLSSPPVVLRDRTVAGLRARMTEFENALVETNSPSRALAAAEALET